MAKILITSLGNGKYDKDTKKTEYQQAKYYVGDKRGGVKETAYMYDAIKHFRGVDKCIFVGTCGSNWHLLYEHLEYSKNLKSPYDENYSLSLLEYYDQKNKSGMDVHEFKGRLNQLKESMGDFCADIVVLKYGLTNEELLENFALLASISKVIKDGDSITFDITHSFRSLAVYELLVINYLKYIGKNIRIDSVTYGMLEYSGQNDGYVPIVDLSQLVNTMEWMKAAEEYDRFGTARLLAGLINENIDIGIQLGKEEKNALKRLGGLAISTNGIKEFRLMIKNCCKIKERIDSGREEENIVIGFIFRDLAGRFGDKIDDDRLLLFELSKWHHEKGRYMESAICAVECILNYLEKLTGIHKNAKIDSLRDKIKRGYSKNSLVKDFFQKYDRARIIRNYLLHGDELDEKEIKELGELGAYFSKTYIEHFMNNPENEDALKAYIE